MNSHLNIFNTYTNAFRTFQLENDLTRALAISMQEDSLFFHEILKEVFSGTKYYSQLFDSLESETIISIDIQQKTSQIGDYEHIFAITLSDTEIGNFWESKHNRKYDPICDVVIRINNVYLIIEAKRDNCDCTSQLYNQILNIVNSCDNKLEILNKSEYQNEITPFDLNWSKLMGIAVKVLSFEKSFGNSNRFLTDFVSLVKSHNFRWLPEASINSLQSNNKAAIMRRIESAIVEASNKPGTNIFKLPYNDRLGIEFSKGWAQEILFDISENGNLKVVIYPGNTKAQGYHLFKNNPIFSDKIEVLNEVYSVLKTYHIKFTSFQKYFTGLWFGENELKNGLYTSDNFNKFTGRKKRGAQWNEIEAILDKCLDFNWKDKCNWDEIINSKKNQFDISFGYEILVEIPFNKLKEIDTSASYIDNLIKLIENIYEQFSNNLLKF